MHYFGLLSIRDVQGVMPRLAIPNQTVKRLMYGYLRDGFRDVGVFSVNLFRFEQLMLRMATEGEWRPVLEFLSEAIARQTGIRDYIGGEKVIQGFLAAFLSVADYLADDRLARQFPEVRFIGLIVVFHGWELVFCNAVRR